MSTPTDSLSQNLSSLLGDVITAISNNKASIDNVQLTPGPQGETGAAGNDGATGPQGPAGNDGATGPQGPAGPAGQDGQDGAPGADGQDGAPGADGQDGAPGADGQDGAPGADGAVGPQGPPGPPGTPADSAQLDANTANIAAILNAADADKDSFAEIVALVNSIDLDNDLAFAGYVQSNDAAVTQNTTDLANLNTAVQGLQSSVATLLASQGGGGAATPSFTFVEITSATPTTYLYPVLNANQQPSDDTQNNMPNGWESFTTLQDAQDAITNTYHNAIGIWKYLGTNDYYIVFAPNDQTLSNIQAGGGGQWFYPGSPSGSVEQVWYKVDEDGHAVLWQSYDWFTQSAVE